MQTLVGQEVIYSIMTRIYKEEYKRNKHVFSDLEVGIDFSNTLRSFQEKIREMGETDIIEYLNEIYMNREIL